MRIGRQTCRVCLALHLSWHAVRVCPVVVSHRLRLIGCTCCVPSLRLRHLGVPNVSSISPGCAISCEYQHGHTFELTMSRWPFLLLYRDSATDRFGSWRCRACRTRCGIQAHSRHIGAAVGVRLAVVVLICPCNAAQHDRRAVPHALCAVPAAALRDCGVVRRTTRCGRGPHVLPRYVGHCRTPTRTHALVGGRETPGLLPPAITGGRSACLQGAGPSLGEAEVHWLAATRPQPPEGGRSGHCAAAKPEGAGEAIWMERDMGGGAGLARSTTPLGVQHRWQRRGLFSCQMPWRR